MIFLFVNKGLWKSYRRQEKSDNYSTNSMAVICLYWFAMIMQLHWIGQEIMSLLTEKMARLIAWTGGGIEFNHLYWKHLCFISLCINVTAQVRCWQRARLQRHLCPWRWSSPSRRRRLVDSSHFRRIIPTSSTARRVLSARMPRQLRPPQWANPERRLSACYVARCYAHRRHFVARCEK